MPGELQVRTHRQHEGNTPMSTVNCTMRRRRRITAPATRTRSRVTPTYVPFSSAASKVICQLAVRSETSLVPYPEAPKVKCWFSVGTTRPTGSVANPASVCTVCSGPLMCSGPSRAAPRAVAHPEEADQDGAYAHAGQARHVDVRSAPPPVQRHHHGGDGGEDHQRRERLGRDVELDDEARADQQAAPPRRRRLLPEEAVHEEDQQRWNGVEDPDQVREALRVGERREPVEQSTHEGRRPPGDEAPRHEVEGQRGPRQGDVDHDVVRRVSGRTGA